MKRFREYEPKQTLLLPPSLEEWLPSDHLVHFVNEVVEEFDLSGIHASYREDRGYPPVEPVFGQIKAGRNLRQVLHRGIDRVRALCRFDVAVQNLLKIYRADNVQPANA